MARRPLGPLLVVPQFEDVITAPETRISVPPEAVANQILQDPIFGHLSTMWNNIETSEELSLRHQTNQVALVQGAASVGIPVDVMRKTMERMADQYGEDLASRLLSRLQRPESMTTSVLSVGPSSATPRRRRRWRGHRGAGLHEHGRGHGGAGLHEHGRGHRGAGLHEQGCGSGGPRR